MNDTVAFLLFLFIFLPETSMVKFWFFISDSNVGIFYSNVMWTFFIIMWAFFIVFFFVVSFLFFSFFFSFWALGLRWFWGCAGFDAIRRGCGQDTMRRADAMPLASGQ